jgi:hypothetical protein
MSEIFNNIKDHSRYDIGSVFGQHFQSKNIITIAISDMGLGIPTNVRLIEPNLSDCGCIQRAVKEGFSAALIRVLRSMSFDDFKRRVRIADASWQIVDVVKRRIYLEMETA